jgi:hypothetical protein
MDELQRQRVLKWAKAVEPGLYDKLFDSVAATRSMGRLRFWQEKLLERILNETGVSVSSAAEYVACLEALTPRERPPTPPPNKMEFEFIDLKPGTVELGWRFDSVLPTKATVAMSEFAFGAGHPAALAVGEPDRHDPPADFRTLFFSRRRTVSVAPFKIATIAVPWGKIFICDDYRNIANVQEACSRFNSKLAKYGWRLPTEDEFEVAAGGELFAWGNEIPDGIPYGKDTRFTKHTDKTSRGLLLNNNPYNVELVSTVFKMGDGGVSICGGNDWPIAWLALSPTYRLPEEMVVTAFPEYLESALVRPVLL